ncbi:MAG: hypothetical protein QRY72_05620 [Candidatus Rhabdochlamydia sp.]
MTEVLNPVYQAPLSVPSSVASKNLDFSSRVEAKEANLGQLIANTYLLVETHSQNKAHLKLDELESLQHKLSHITSFLKKLEGELSKDHEVKTISMTDDHELIRTIHELTDIPLLKEKTSWTRAEAEAIRSSLTRDSQLHMQKVQNCTMAVNRLIEEGTELLHIARKCLEMLDRLHQTFTQNQRRG